METNGGAAPTGCYKCGRPGHWSRDCPSTPNTNPNPNSDSNNDKFSNKPSATSHPFKSFQSKKQPVEKPKKVPKTRPKLTPDLLLSDDGLGFVLRHFPKAFKFRGRGHETNDLGHLLSLYSEWHSHLIPYYSFNQFVHKVEQLGGSKRVKKKGEQFKANRGQLNLNLTAVMLCINDLRERVANGGDPTKLLETPQPDENTNHEQDANDIEEPNSQHEDTMPNNDTDDIQHDIFQEIYENTTNEPTQPLNNGATVADTSTQKELPSQTTNSNKIEFSEEIKARIEANRLKALERAAARKLKQVSESQPS